ncbi:MAG: VWA domain-containing protein [Acidobacteriota bacterium]
MQERVGGTVLAGGTAPRYRESLGGKWRSVVRDHQRRLCAALFVSLFLAEAGSGQEAKQTPRSVFRVTSSRVLIEFIAVDKEGRFVNDLSLDELELKVDKKKRTIDRLFPPGTAHLEGVSPLSLAEQVSPHAPRVSQPVSGTGQQPAPQGESLSTVRTVILLDSRVLDASNFHHSVVAIQRFIERSLRANHLVMIAQINPGLRIETPFTQDRETLLKTLSTLRPSTVYNPLDPLRMTGAGGRGIGSSYIDDLQKQVTYLHSGLRLLCYSLSGLPGRKHLVFFSEGYPLRPLTELDMRSRQGTAFSRSADARQAASRQTFSRKDPGVLPMVREIVALANDFGISFYTVDARGLVAVPAIGPADVSGDVAAGPGEPPETRLANTGTGRQPGAVSEQGATEILLSTFLLTNLSSLDDAKNVLIALASGTNGSAFFGSNDLGAVLRASTVEQEQAYTASFVPKYKGKPKFHQVRVKSKRKGVIIRSQVGFHDFSESDMTNVRLAMAFQHPELFKHLRPVLRIQPGPDQAQVVFGVPGAQVLGRPNGNSFQIDLVVVGQVYDGKGKPLSKQYAINRGFRLGVSRQQFQSLARQPLLARQDLKLSKGHYKLVLTVMDRVAGTMGVESREFDVL